MPRRPFVPDFPTLIAILWTLVAFVPAPRLARAQEAADDTVYRRFDEISAMRANGEFDRAIEELRGIIREQEHSDEISRRAHNDLVFTILSKRSIASSEEARRALDAEARTLATDALRRYPDLVADRHYFPTEINLIYDDLRETMFGEVHIETSPGNCRVRIGDAYEGTSPISIPYFPVGTYGLEISRDGYTPRADTLAVIPGGVVQREISLSKRRGRKWWLVPTIAGAAIIAGVAMSGDDGGGNPDDGELPGPPPPPQ